MKTLILISLFAAGTLSTNQRPATVSNPDGVFYFIGAAPSDPYTVVFSVKTSKLVWSDANINTVGEIKRHLKKQADKKKTPYQGLILDDQGGASAIVFVD